MRRVMLIVGVAAVVGCGGISKEQYGAKEAEAAKYKKALQEESGKVAALEAKVTSVEQQNAALQAQMGDVKNQLSASGADAGAAKSELQAMQEKVTVRLNQQLLFPENSSKLSADSKRALDAIADALAQLKDKRIIVAGFTDDKEGGKDAVAKRWQLSSARALEIAKYLAGRGLDPSMLAVAGFGPGRPVAPNDSLANRALNRRAEIALTPADQTFGTMDVKPAELKSK